MKKVSLFMVFLALCMAFYGLSAVYATISTLKLAPNTSEQSARITNDYGTPMPSQPNLGLCGDPIEDPRPNSFRPIML